MWFIERGEKEASLAHGCAEMRPMLARVLGGNIPDLVPEEPQ
jgi:hypothetical protein